MHMVIKILTFANSKEEALSQAKEILAKNLCGEGRPFDYYTTFDDNSSTVSGKARWGNLPPVVKASSVKGKELIEEGMKATWKLFKRSMDCIRPALAIHSDEEIFNEKCSHLAHEKNDIGLCKTMYLPRHFMYCAGRYEGPDIWLYDHDGVAIRDVDRLKNVISHWSDYYEKKGQENPYKNMELFVVPADVHY